VWQPVFDKATPPIYRQDQAGRSLFYAPGELAVVPAKMIDDFQAALDTPGQANLPQGVQLMQRAREAKKTWDAMKIGPFIPLCLTLYLNNTCNLKCNYCFSKPYRSQRSRLSLDVIRSAAEIVALNCRAQQRSMTVVFHGGGEPTLDYDLLVQSLDMIEKIASDYKLGLFKYIATNGIMARSRAVNLAQRFDLVGLSCDGPEDIQERQRPLQRPNGHTSTWWVEQTAQAVHASRKPLHVRVTITPDTLDRQSEIAEYICRVLKPQEIHVEPVYAGEASERGSQFKREQAEAYVNAFLQARQTAHAYGIPWISSGSRPREIHSTYCHIWRNVLNLTPEGVATACFKLSEAGATYGRGVAIGGWNEEDGCFELASQEIQSLSQALNKEPEYCINCFNRYHCARQCPDDCLLELDAQADGFRCRAQALLADSLIQETADELASSQNNNKIFYGTVTGIG